MSTEIRNQIRELNTRIVTNSGNEIRNEATRDLTALASTFPVFGKTTFPLLKNRKYPLNSIGDGFQAKAYFRFVNGIDGATITITNYRGTTKIFECKTSGTNGALVLGKITFLAGNSPLELAENFKTAIEDTTNGHYAGGFQLITTEVNTATEGDVLLTQNSGTLDDVSTYIDGNTEIVYTGWGPSDILDEGNFLGGVNVNPIKIM